MIDRRRVLKTALGYGSALSAPALFASHAGAADGGRKFYFNPRGMKGRYERMATLDLESRIGFTSEFRALNVANRKRGDERAKQILRENGIALDAPMEWNQAADLFEGDPLLATNAHQAIVVQKYMWDDLQRHFHEYADVYLAEMEETDGLGPGSLQLNPDLYLPKYTTHEIHLQPGGYVGDPFAGHIYYYGTNARRRHNFQDMQHRTLARNMPLAPADGRVRRVLDLGCSIGGLTMGLKERFPDAEVWGLDCGAPMVRYAHMRSVNLGSDVHYVQALAEDTKFPDNSFDVVASYLFFHEVPSFAAEEIINEAARILRPGGVYHPYDARNWKQLTFSAYAQWQSYWIYRWNYEVWAKEHRENDYPKIMADAGFDVTIRERDGRLTGIKRA